MAADQGNVVVDGCLGGGADRISDLPDHLLHRILIRLPSTTVDAARTSVLSRRWRRVWTHIPELVLDYYYCGPEGVDAALAACSAPVLHRLEIALQWFYWRGVTAQHVCSWLRFASERLAGELRLSVPGASGELVLLPVCGRFTAIRLSFVDSTPRLRFLLLRRLGGVFTVLAALTIRSASLENRELEEAVSSRCPRLKELKLENITLLSRHHVLSIRSDSLEKLRVDSDIPCPLQVATPELQEPSMFLWGESWGEGIDAHIAAPKLSKVFWREVYNPSRHKLVEAGRYLKRLELNETSRALLGRFDAIDELHLNILIPAEDAGEYYKRILEDTSRIRCQVLVVTFLVVPHAFEPIMLYLLRKCVGIRKLVVGFIHNLTARHPCKLSSCPCKLAHNHLITSDILLDSLEEVLVDDQRAGDEKQIVGLVSLVCRCSETFQKKVHITISQGNRPRSMDMRRHIDILLASAPNNKVEITILFRSLYGCWFICEFEAVNNRGVTFF